MNMRSYIEFVRRNPMRVLLVIGALTLLALASLSRASIGTSMGKLFLGRTPSTRLPGQDRGLRGSVPPSSASRTTPCSPMTAGLDSRARWPGSRAAAPGGSPAGSTRPDPAARGRHLGGYLRGVPGGSRRSRARGPGPEVLADQQVSDTLLGGQGTLGVLVIELPPGEHESEQAPQLVANVIELLEEAGYRPSGLHQAGLVAMMGELMSATRQSIEKLFPLVTLVLLSIVWLTFRQFWPVLLSGFTSLLAVIWMMGLAVAIDPRINISLAMAPIVAMVVSFSDVVHLYSYLRELAEGQPKEEALRSGAEVGEACLVTSITTLLGFLGLSSFPPRCSDSSGWSWAWAWRSRYCSP